ncbi:MAG: hypothetical protein J1F35_01000 [Erysipelotrichales bacterium]|nr:hypothetical protein [Erysipelotrichales bacterium]
MKNEKDYEVVGNIRIKQPKNKKAKKKKNASDTSLITKIFVWFMFVAMFASFIVPLIYYLISVISGS